MAGHADPEIFRGGGGGRRRRREGVQCTDILRSSMHRAVVSNRSMPSGVCLYVLG